MADSTEQLDVVVRIHSVKRFHELSRCIFSLVCQDYLPATIKLCTQRFSEEEIEFVRTSLKPTMAINPLISLEVLNYTGTQVEDARSLLLNFGIQNSKGRYLSFLDYDDVIFPQGYSLLINEIKKSEAAIAFGGIELKRVHITENCMISADKEYPFKGEGLLDLFRDNFCPIHSFVIDKSKVDSSILQFDPLLTRCEDYEFLLRFCAVYPASFQLKDKVIGDYYYKDDGSNTNLAANVIADEKNQKSWRISREFLDQRKKMILVSEHVQRSLGFTVPQAYLTIEELLRKEPP